MYISSSLCYSNDLKKEHSNVGVTTNRSSTMQNHILMTVGDGINPNHPVMLYMHDEVKYVCCIPIIYMYVITVQHSNYEMTDNSISHSAIDARHSKVLLLMVVSPSPTSNGAINLTI